ncbi:MAG: site-specific DNA-methyltransferase [Kiritimatiellaeota bacterium]|nr:site-specific DNA-methyltransferase [Kiritimatiellota bacterium]
MDARLTIYHGDNLDILKTMPSESVDLMYVDPPFNTGKRQKRTSLKTVRDEEAGDRTGYQGKRYRTEKTGSMDYRDVYEDYLGFLRPRMEEARRILKPDGSLFVHNDYREVHYVKIMLDGVFGRDSFINEIIWSYDYGARSKSKWPTKHDTILWYAKNPKNYQFHLDACDRIPYMAPGLVGPEKAARGKLPTDSWWHTIVSPNSKEKTGYPTQKPRGILDRLVKVHSRPGDTLLDFFAGSGSFGEAAAALGRHCLLIDDNPQAIAVMQNRLAAFIPATTQP